MKEHSDTLHLAISTKCLWSLWKQWDWFGGEHIKLVPFAVVSERVQSCINRHYALDTRQIQCNFKRPTTDMISCTEASAATDKALCHYS